jgi:hypothetical protein
MVYCCEGMKKMCIKTSRVNSVLDTLEIMHQDNILNDEVIKTCIIQ